MESSRSNRGDADARVYRRNKIFVLTISLVFFCLLFIQKLTFSSSTC